MGKFTKVICYIHVNCSSTGTDEDNNNKKDVFHTSDKKVYPTFSWR